MGALCNVGQNTVSRWETGDSRPGPKASALLKRQTQGEVHVGNFDEWVHPKTGEPVEIGIDQGVT